MRTAFAVAIIASVLIVGIAVAQSRNAGGVPALWDAVDSLSETMNNLVERVAALEAGGSGTPTDPALLQRLNDLENETSELQSRVESLENEAEKLRNDNDALKNSLNQLTSLPIEIAARDTVTRLEDGIPGDTEFPTVPIEIVQMALVGTHPLTLGDFVNGDAIGDIVIVTDVEFSDLLQFPGGTQCNAGNTVFGSDRSPGSTGITGNYTHSKNATVVSQFQNWTSVPNGNMSCAPAATGSAIEYWNRTLSGFDRGSTLFNITDRLHRMMGTDHVNGTSTRGWLHGITVWINRTGYAQNMTITVRGQVVSSNSTFTHYGVNITTITGIDDFLISPINFAMILEEFVDKNEFVILIVEAPGGGHAVALHSLSNTPNENGNFSVAVMDPATGEIKEVEIEPDGDMCVRYSATGECEETRPILNIFSISLNND